MSRRRFRAATGIERLQLKWLTFSALLVPLTLVVCLVGAAVAGGVEDDGAFNALFLFMLGAIPASIGVAVLRYRLYAIDRLINRTLVYGVLTLLLAAAYGATALVLGTALGSGSGWTTAGATLAAAVAFRPLRARVQDVVDRRFSRARYDARRRIAEFLEDLRAGRARPEAIEPILGEVLSDPVLELRFWLPEGEIYVDARGRPVDDSHDEPAADRGAAGRSAARDGPAQPAIARAAGAARGGRRRCGPGDRDRPTGGRVAPPARGGGGIARPDRRGRLRGAPADRTRPPRRRAGAAGLDRARPAPRTARAGSRLRRRNRRRSTVPSRRSRLRSTSFATWRGESARPSSTTGSLPRSASSPAGLPSPSR